MEAEVYIIVTEVIWVFSVVFVTYKYRKIYENYHIRATHIGR